MLAQAVLRPSDTSLNAPFLFDVSGCGAERLCRAVTRVMESHPSLHSVIVDFTAMARILRDVGDAYGDPGMTPGTGTARAGRTARPRARGLSAQIQNIGTLPQQHFGMAQCILPVRGISPAV